jgi:UDPglucose 6-dehydrogenase
MSVPTVGIIGTGFVGTAVLNGFKYVTDVSSYDKFKPGNGEVEFDVAIQQDVLFVCVPTPQDSFTGECNTSIVEEVLTKINARITELKLTIRPVIVKSTIPHDFCRRMQPLLPNITLIHSPEFLTERRASHDFATQSRVILGLGDIRTMPAVMFEATLVVNRLFYGTFGRRFDIVSVSWEEAGLLKYALNCFLATKVSFMNELVEIAEAAGVDPHRLIDLMKGDGRISVHHMEVPGPDGKRGYGGGCFPKDMAALISIAAQLGVEPKVLRAAVEKNIDVRNQPV